MKEHLGFLDRLSDAPVRRLGHTVSIGNQPTTSQSPIDDLHRPGEDPAGAIGHIEEPPTIVELEMEGLSGQVYLPCHSHQKTLHYYRVRKYADVMVLGVVVSFVALLLIIELWDSIRERYGMPNSQAIRRAWVGVSADMVYSLRRCRTGEGAIRLEVDSEGAKSNYLRKECIPHQSLAPRPILEAGPVSSPVAEKKGELQGP